MSTSRDLAIKLITGLCVLYAFGYMAIAHLVRLTSSYVEYVDEGSYGWFVSWVPTFGPVWDLTPFFVLTIPVIAMIIFSFIGDVNATLNENESEDPTQDAP